MKIITLSQSEIRKVLELDKVIECVKKTYIQKSDGDTVVWPSIVATGKIAIDLANEKSVGTIVEI